MVPKNCIYWTALFEPVVSGPTNYRIIPIFRPRQAEGPNIYLQKRFFWFPLLSQDYLVIQIEWLWLDLNTKKWFARPNLSLIKNGWYYHYQWQINYQLRLNMRKCPILGIYFAWLHFKSKFWNTIFGHKKCWNWSILSNCIL